MKTTTPIPIQSSGNKLPMPLAEQLDPAIGEASSVMGAMLTEMVRRTLRGGVQQIGDELNGFVAERVDAAIVERTPMIEQTAADVALTTARATAEEVAAIEVRALEKQTRASDEQLAGRIEEAAKSADEKTTSSARELAARIEEAERRARETAHADTALLMQDLLNRSREGTALLKTRLSAVETAATDLGQQQSRLREQLLQAYEARMAHMQQLHDALAARILELEKPRGLRKIGHGIQGGFQRLFSRRPAEAKTDTPAAESAEE